MENKQQILSETIKHDKKATIVIERGLDYKLKQDWNCFIKGDMCIYHSSGGSGEGYKGDENDLEAKLRFLLSELKEELEREGYKPENIELIEKPFTEEDFNEWKEKAIKSEEYWIPNDKKNIEKAKEELTEKITELTKKIQNIQKIKKVEFKDIPINKKVGVKKQKKVEEKKEVKKEEVKETSILSKETDKRLFHLMRLCHPNEKGEKCDRSDVIDEIQKRGKSVLKGIDWNSDLKSIYKNRYTADEDTLENLLKGIIGNSEEWAELPFIIENWTPKELWTDKDCFDEYNPKGKLNAWIKK